MGFIETIIHLLVPRHTNNQKAKLIHSSSLLVIACLMIVFQGLITLFPRIGPSILGYAAQISPDEVVRLTNEKRSAVGLPALSLNSTLSAAAYSKGSDMITKDYWSHVAPDGTQPWKFFTDFGYKYRYAGENLARDFSNPSSAVEAWMSSPTHKENILNPNYKEIGIGVVEGDLAGIDTTIIVQFFGSSYVDTVTQPVAQVKKAAVVQTPIATLLALTKPTLIPEKATPTPFVATPVPVIAVASAMPSIQAYLTSPNPAFDILISPFSTTKSISIAVIAILLTVYVLDSFIVSKRKITRIGGRAFAHVAFLGMVLVVILILQSGKIL